MDRHYCFITLFSPIVLFCTTVGMNKQIHLREKSTNKNARHFDPQSLIKSTQPQSLLNQNKMMAKFVKYSWVVKFGTKLALPAGLKALGLKEAPKKPDQTKECLGDTENKLKEKLNKTSPWIWIWHYATKIASIVTGGFINWQIGYQTEKFISAKATNPLKDFGTSVCMQAVVPIGATLFGKITGFPPAPPENPPLKELANPLRIMHLIPVVTELTISTMEACEQSCRKYLNGENKKISPQSILKQTSILFAQRKLREYLVPLATVAVRKLGPKITREIRQTEYDLAKVKHENK